MRGQPPPRVTARHPRGAQHPTWHARQCGSTGSPHPHTRAHSRWAADPDHALQGRAAGRGRAPNLRRPSQRREAAPPGTPSRHCHSLQCQLARAHAVGLVLGFQPRTTQANGTMRVTHASTTAPTASNQRTPAAHPKGGQRGEGERPTQGAAHKDARQPPGEALPPPPQRATPARESAR